MVSCFEEELKEISSCFRFGKSTVLSRLLDSESKQLHLTGHCLGSKHLPGPPSDLARVSGSAVVKDNCAKLIEKREH